MRKRRGLASKIIVFVLILIIVLSAVAAAYLLLPRRPERAPPEEQPEEERPAEELPPEKMPEEVPAEKPPEEAPPREERANLTVLAPPTIAQRLPEDLDGDGIPNVEELRWGLDPENPDTDGDGIWDGLEARVDEDGDGLINALDVDSDDDGLLDGQEDENLDGNVDIGETDPSNPDTDGDGIGDGQEVMAGTDPLNPDTDEDGLLDGVEPRWYEDTDGDGLINALDSDSDGDGLGDGMEAEIGTRILEPDTDGDGLPDGQEFDKGLDPLSKDTDGDGLEDGDEAYDDLWIEAEDVAVNREQVLYDPEASGNHTVSSEPAGVLCHARPHVGAGRYRIWLRAKAVGSLSGLPTLQVQVYLAGERLLAEWHVMPYIVVNGSARNVYRWFSTSQFEIPEGGDFELVVTTPASDAVLLDRILIQRVEGWEVPPTDPRNPDTDGDGLLDGQELLYRSFWFEAEHHASGTIWSSGDFSNGMAVEPGLHDGILDYVVLEGVLERGWYSLFVRAAPIGEELTTLNVYVHLKDVRLNGTCEVFPQYPRGRWSAVYFEGDLSRTSFWVEGETPVEIWIWANATESAPALVDRVALFRMEFSRPWQQLFSQDARPLPRALDPLDPDTDGDQFRMVEGALEGSVGYLTDGFEWKLGLNPFDLDTDNDGLFWANFTAPCADDVDPSPLTWDYDRDGLFDWIEDHDGDGKFEPQFGETDMRDADTDDDGIIDGNEDPNYQGYDVYETDPLLPDTDGDGLLDGIEVGLEEPQRPEATDGWPGGGGRATDPTDWDTDDDGLPDGWIDFNGDGEPSPGEFEDVDLDGLTDPGRWGEGGETDPLSPDTDGDGLDDRYEVMNGLDPLETQPFDLSLEGIRFAPQRAVLGPAENETEVVVLASIRNLGPGRLPLTSRGRPLLVMLNLTIVEGDEVVKRATRAKRVELGVGEGIEARFGTIRLGPGRYEVRAKLYVMLAGGTPFTELNEENDAASSSIEVLAPPAAWAEMVSVQEIINGFNVTFRFGAEDPDSKELAFAWDFDGDGEFDREVRAPAGQAMLVWANITGTGNHYPVLKVTDGDGLEDEERLAFGLWHLWEGDYDGDGLSSEEEAELKTDPENPDTDGDGLLDGVEVRIGSNPLSKDSDSDGMEDGLEYSLMVAVGLDPDTKPDYDQDGLINILDTDSDDDGLPDGREIICIDVSKAEDLESWSGSNPYSKDTDMDGLTDKEESDLGTDPLSPDTDGDGLDDFYEALYGTKPTEQDTDKDGIADSVDLQPLSGPIEKVYGEYALLGTYWRPGLVKFTDLVQVYWLKGKAYRMDVAEWYEISSENVRSREAVVEDVLGFDWGGYRVLGASERDGMVVAEVEGTEDLFPPYFKVKYEVRVKEFETTFINKDWVECNGFWSGVVWSAVDSQNESIVIQFRVSQDRYYRGDGVLTTAGLIYKVYDDPSFEEKGPVLSSLVPAVRIDEKVYQVELPLPPGYDRVAIFISPVWIDMIGDELKLSPLSGDSMTFGALAKVIYFEDGRRLLYGLSSFEDLSYPIPEGLEDAEAYQRSMDREFGLVEFSGEDFTFKKVEVFEGVIVEEKALHRLAYERVVEERHYATLEELKEGIGELDLEDVEGAIEDVGDSVEALNLMSEEKGVSVKGMGVYLVATIAKKEVATAISSKGEIWAKMVRLYEPVKKAFQEVKELRTAYGEFKLALEKVRMPKAVKAPGLKFLKKTIQARKAALKSPLKAKSLYITVAVGMVEISANLYMASKASTTFERSYYLAQATLAGIFLCIAIALYFVPGGQVIGLIITVVLLIPGVREKLEEFSDWLTAGWEEMLGEVPTKFALEMFKKGCKSVQQEAEKALNRGYLAITVLPKWG